MAVVSIPDEGRRIDDPAELAGFLAEYGICHERWPLAELLRLWRAAGVEDVSCRRLSLGGGIVTWGRRS